MTKTRDDIIRRALMMLGVLGAGQPVAAEDAERIDLDAVAEQLAAERVIDVVQDVRAGELPLALYLPFAGVVAAKSAAEFSVPPETMARLLAESLESLRTIERRMRPLANTYIGKIVGC